MAELIKMPFGMMSRVGPKESYIRWVRIGTTWHTWLNRPCVAVMPPFCQITSGYFSYTWNMTYF